MPERPGYNPEEEQKERYKKMSYYELLGVPENASKTQVKNAFREKIATAHTDHGGDLDYAQFLGEAYATLKDSEERAKYDVERGTQTRYNQPKSKQPHAKNHSSKKHATPPPPEPEQGPEVYNQGNAGNAEVSLRDQKIVVIKAKLEEKAFAGRAKQEDRLKKSLERRK